MATAQAIAKEIRHAPRKVGEIAALVRDRSVDDALVILTHTPRRAAEPVRKVIESAAANATNNHKIKRDGLMIESIEVGVGTSLKRFRPAASGMAKPYKRRNSNIKVVVSGQAKPDKKKPVKKSTTDAKQSKKVTA